MQFSIDTESANNNLFLMLVDWSRIEVLADQDDPDDVEWLDGVIKDLVIDIDARLLEIKEMIEKNDQETLRATLHQMKGVASNFGLMQMLDICIHSEGLIKEGNPSPAYIEAGKLPSTWELTKTELRTKFSF